ncbi:hypothetical protein AB2B41_14695 [Marimonas sp. MJW-29]|uniref:Uncharacterized protein n=1 Tax=Sulfitobacter sediminis TaxID=3234186 RepID=A0ABV3RPG3_9RHOB
MSSAAMASEIFRIALPESPTAETAAFLLALQRAERAGLPVEVTVLAGEEAVIDAVASGIADAGVGTP